MYIYIRGILGDLGLKGDPNSKKLGLEGNPKSKLSVPKAPKIVKYLGF